MIGTRAMLNIGPENLDDSESNTILVLHPNNPINLLLSWETEISRTENRFEKERRTRWAEDVNELDPGRFSDIRHLDDYQTISIYSQTYMNFVAKKTTVLTSEITRV
jgi:hypothetical protein